MNKEFKLESEGGKGWVQVPEEMSTCEMSTCDFCKVSRIVQRQYIHAENKPKTGNGFVIIKYCSDCGLRDKKQL